MRSVVLSAVVGAGLVGAAWGLAADGRPVSDDTSGSGSKLITHVVTAGEGRQLLLVIDPETRVLSAYQIGLANGEIELRGVRNLTWDLQLSHYNGVSPLPRDIRAMLEQP
jgi:hypothetical protein